MFKLLVLVAAIPATLNGCATTTPFAAAKVTITRGGCFGFCPVYTLETGRDGAVKFTGVRHTAYLGVKHHRVSPRAAHAIFGKLEPFRPVAASSVFPCSNAVTDQAQYVVTWGGPGSAAARSLEFNSGCHSPEGNRLRLLLESIPGLLGVGAEAKQLTRPGVSRG